MKLKFIGVGDAFAKKEHYQSNACIELENDKLFLIDCGVDARFAISEVFPFINNSNVGKYVQFIYVSHIHADHIGGLEWLAYATYLNPESPKPTMVISPKIKQELWENSLKGGLEIVGGEKNKTLDDYFGILQHRNIILDHKIKIKMVESPHVRGEQEKFSFGLFIETENKKTYFTADVMFENYNKNKQYYQSANQIFHDCATTPYKSGVHAHYEDLKTLPNEIKNKMYLYHYSDDALEKYNPEEDGFKGFVKKGFGYDI
jgi:ribonuclease BN (tRNA processing enzyme)